MEPTKKVKTENEYNINITTLKKKSWEIIYLIILKRNYQGHFGSGKKYIFVHMFVRKTTM